MLSFAGAGRVHQDNTFVIPELVGRRIEQLIGLVDTEGPDDAPIAVNRLPEGATWQRFFLDAGLAIWEDWTDIADEEDEHSRFVDYTERERLRGELIQAVRATPAGEHGHAQLTIELASGRTIALSFSDHDDLEAGTRISFTQLPP